MRPRDTNLVSDAVEVLGQLEGGTDERRQAGANPLWTPLSEVFPKDNKQSVLSEQIADVIAYKGFKPGIFFFLYLVSAKSDRLL